VLRKAVEANPTSRELSKAFARALLGGGDPHGAENQLRRFAAANPQDMQARADLGDFLLSRGNAAEAGKVYREIRDAAPAIPLGHLKLAGLHAGARRIEEAAAVLESGLSANPDSAQLLQALVEAYLAQGRTDQAVALCRGRLDSNPREVFTLNLLGRVYAAAREFDRAEAAFKAAIDLDPMWAEPYGNLAGLTLRQGRAAAAEEAFRAAIASSPKSPSAYLALGFILQEQKKVPEAIRVYGQGIANVPNFWVALNNLAFLLAEHGASDAEYQRALELARTAQRLQPERLSIADTLGWTLFKAGHIDQALAVFAGLLEKAPEDPVLNYHAGMVLRKAGRLDEAREKLKTALAHSGAFPGREEAEKALREIAPL
jgi:Flp pilus assembly protein TadD